MATDANESLSMLSRIEEQIPQDNVRLKTYVQALKEQLESQNRLWESKEEELSQFREAYEKLTQPANRIGVYLKPFENNAVILLGDTEYVVTIDPSVKPDTLSLGTRVRLNEGYAIIGLAPEIMTGALVKVAENINDGRIRIGSETPGGESRIIFRGDNLKKKKIKQGDEVRLDTSGRIAVEHIEKKDSRDYFLENIQPVEWSQVGGQDNAIQLIKETIEMPLLNKNLYAKFGKKSVKGVLLYGPPGCGKTLIGKATAYNLAKEYSKRKGKEVKEYFMSISGPKILNMWVGETERMVREIFATAREKAKDGYLVFIFMDEAEAILRTRSSGRNFSMSNTVVPQFCAELDGLESLENVVLVLTSNRPDYIDPAILRPGRIDRKVKIVRPDREAARTIFNIYLGGDIPLDDNLMKQYSGERECAQKHLVDTVLKALWTKSSDNEFLTISMRNGKSENLLRGELITGAIIESIVDRAKEMAIRRTLADSPKEEMESGWVSGIGENDMLAAMEQEFKENEIFPKTDSVTDWLQLLDIESESVMDIRSSINAKKNRFQQKNIV
jgi:proteasome-associated ATPase